MRTLAGAVVVVTGASRGIGRAIAEVLGHDGAKVVVNYSKSKGPAEEVVAHLLQNGAQGAVAIQADVSKADQAAKLIEDAANHFGGRLDVLVNNAGINIDRSLRKLSVEDWDTVIQHDLSSYFYTVRAAQSYFIQQKSGTIVNISSMVGQAGNFGQANYAAAKAGIIGFTKAAALELARFNVTVNAVCPGYTDTDMLQTVPNDIRESLTKKIPLGRFASPEEIGRAVRYLVVDGEYITGESLTINGGLYMK